MNYFRIQDNKPYTSNNNYGNEAIRSFNEGTTRTKRGVASHRNEYDSAKLTGVRNTRGGGIGRGRGKNRTTNSSTNFLLNSAGKSSVSNTSNTVVSVTSVAPPTSSFLPEANLIAIQQQQQQQNQEQQQQQQTLSPQPNNSEQHHDSIDNTVIMDTLHLTTNLVTTPINEIDIATTEILTPVSQYQASS